jgi:EAL domain-containing protein (putative c-di-GMP-specific phosphodiesterase class I)
MGLAAAMDLAIIDMALEDVALLPPGYVSINLSAATLTRLDSLRDRLQRILERTPIVLELTEHAMIHDYDAVADGLRLLREAGVLLAVDDAGAGYSTFQHILRLRPDIIKLDRSITNGIDRDPARRALTTALGIFAAEIQASVVAEGIETEGELNALRMTGITRGQGFWLAQPSRLPLPEIQYRPTSLLEILGGSSQPLFVRSDTPRNPVGSPFVADPVLAVVIHGLLSSLALVTRAVERLRTHDGAVPLEEFRVLTRVMDTQLAHVTETLKDIVGGLPPQTLKTLDGLARRRVGG